MRIKKSFAIVLASMIVIAILFFTGIIVLIFSPQKASYDCILEKDKYPQGYDCGYHNSSVDNKSHILVGKVAKVYQKNNESFLEIYLKDSNKNNFTESFLLPSTNKIGIVTSTLLDPDERIGNIVTMEKGEIYQVSEVVKLLQEDEEIQISVYTPNGQDIVNIQQKLGKTPQTTCYSYHTKLIRFLKDSTFQNRLTLLFEKITSTCTPHTQTITRYK